jgi:GNAT superfamily N-acetyltransferase
VPIREYRDGDAPAAIELLRTAFGDWPGPRVLAHDRPAEFFRWKHETNPQGASFIVLAEEDGRLIGMRAYMPWLLTADGAPTGAVQGVDLATHPDARGRGINSQLQRHAMDTLRDSTAFSLGMPNDMSKSQSRKAGWRPMGRLPVWVGLRRPLSVARGARALRAPSAGAPPAVEAATAESVLAQADWAAELPRAARAKEGRFSTVSDLAYLRWRYQPVLADYRAIAEPGAGLAIFRLRRRGKLCEATICELLAADGGTAARLLREVARAAPFDYLVAAAPLARAGLIRSPLGGPQLGVTLYREHVDPDPVRRSSWALSMGDIERLELS